jgi:hypothetical protein
MDTLVADN